MNEKETIPAQRIDTLSVRGFRNLVQQELNPGSHFNVIFGDNGAGKSNLLEAIYYCGALKSFRSARTDDMIALNAQTAHLQARFQAQPLPTQLHVTLDRNKARRVQVDQKRIPSLSHWHKKMQMVLFHPGDIRLSQGGPEKRRSYVDRILEQMDSVFAASKSTYDKALRSRNRLLKQTERNRNAITAYDEILANAGEVIGQSRKQLIEHLRPQVERAFSEVVGQALPFSMHYAPRVEPNAQRIREALDNAYAKDCARGFTADGPHGDDIALQVGEVAAKHHASQGQHRALVLALKVAELFILAEHSGKVPILLLDDVSSELDRTRNQRFFSLLAKMGGQVFLTTTHREFILLDENRVDFHVVNGQAEIK